VLERVSKARSLIGATGRREAHRCGFSMVVQLGGEELIAGGAAKWPRSPTVWPVSDVEPVGCSRCRQWGRRWVVCVGVLEEVDGRRHGLSLGGMTACGHRPRLGLA
jgi:hypothetical protein